MTYEWEKTVKYTCRVGIFRVIEIEGTAKNGYTWKVWRKPLSFGMTVPDNELEKIGSNYNLERAKTAALAWVNRQTE